MLVLNSHRLLVLQFVLRNPGERMRKNHAKSWSDPSKPVFCPFSIFSTWNQELIWCSFVWDQLPFCNIGSLHALFWITAWLLSVISESSSETQLSQFIWSQNDHTEENNLDYMYNISHKKTLNIKQYIFKYLCCCCFS